MFAQLSSKTSCTAWIAEHEQNMSRVCPYSQRKPEYRTAVEVATGRYHATSHLQ